MAHVKPKKFLGQHFLKDENIARKIAESLSGVGYKKALEIGPGMGVLTQFLLQNPAFETYAIELDKESVEYLKNHYPDFSPRLIEGDFLEIDLNKLFSEPFALTGNFPYNISSQIIFKMLEHRNQIPEMAGMFQKEVAERFSAKTRTKAYGILSVLLQTFYDIEYLFTVHENVFIPPPKVKSGVVRAVRNNRNQLPVSEKLYFDVIKTAFNQRRKTLRNSLKKFGLPDTFWVENNMEKSRPEELTVEEFITLTQLIEKINN